MLDEREEVRATRRHPVQLVKTRFFFTEAYAMTIPELNPRATPEPIAASTPSATTEEAVERAPDIIELGEDEKFRDDEGNIIEIETRGERTHDGI